jgi:voltage-gated sodium channel
MTRESLSERAGVWIESRPVQKIIVALIAINAVVLGMETSPRLMAAQGHWLSLADHTILTVFVAEIAIKLYAFRYRFFVNPWNVFDFVVVGIALVPAAGPLAVMRVLRVLRVLRLISMVPQLRFVVEALLRAIPGIAAIGALMFILFYVFAVMATGLFGAAFPDWFGTIGRSMYTLFQVMTLESWSMGIVRPIMEVQPYAWVYFIPFILLATFTMLNLFIGIIVNTMQTLHEVQHGREQVHIEQVMHEDTALVAEEVKALRDEIRALRAELAGRRNPAPPGGSPR